KVTAALAAVLAAGQLPTEAAVRAQWGEETPWALAARVSVPAVDLQQYDALLEGALVQVGDRDRAPERGIGMSLEGPGEEHGYAHGRDTGVGALPQGVVPAGDPGGVCRGRSAGDGPDLELPRLLARTGAAGVPAAAATPHRAAAAGVEVTVGEELAGV